MRLQSLAASPKNKKTLKRWVPQAAIGSVEDADFLVSAFTGADAVYTMVPPANYFNPNIDLMTYCVRIGNNYAHVIKKSDVKRVVHLGSIGAHLEKDSGLILGHRAVELILAELSGVSITFLRPAGFYYNLYSFLKE